MSIKLIDELRDTKSWSLISIILPGIAGAIMIGYSTVWGPWVFSDSTVYLTVARNHSEGIGFGMFNPSGIFSPLYHYPPFYPLILSALAKLNLDVLDAARWLNIILFALTVITLGSVFYVTTKSPWLTMIFTSTVALLPELLKIFSGAMSEPLSMFLGFAGLILLVLYIDKKNKAFLYLSSGLVGLASLTRYVATAYLFAGMIALLILHKGSWKRRLGDLLQYTVIGLIPLISWFVWLSSQNNTARIFHMSQNIWADLGPLRIDLIGIVWSWVPFSDRIPPLSYNNQKIILLTIVALALVLFTTSILYMIRRDPVKYPRKRTIILGGIFGIFIVAYIATLAFAYVSTIPQPDIDTRMLIPVHLAVIMLIFLSVSFLIYSWSNLKIMKYLQIITLVFLISFLPESVETLRDYHHAGYGYTSKRWRESETIKAIQELPPEIALVSNEAALLLFYTGRSAYEIPELIYSENLSEFTRYGENPDDQGEKLFNENKAALILFDNIYYQFERLDGLHAQERLDAFIKDLNVYAEYQDGTIFFYEPTEP